MIDLSTLYGNILMRIVNRNGMRSSVLNQFRKLNYSLVSKKTRLHIMIAITVYRWFQIAKNESKTLW